MSYAEELMKSWEEKPEDKPVETPAPEETKPEENTTPQETPQETPPADENKGGGTEDTPPVEKGAEGPETQNTDTPPEDKPEDKPADPPKEKPDLSNLSQEEKAQHAFRRQLNKQQSKYEAIIADMNSKFDTVSKELAEIKKAKKDEPLKTRADFPLEAGGDDEYIKYLVKQGMDAERAEQAAKDAAAKAEQDKKDQEAKEAMEQQQRMADLFNENCRTAFKDEAYTGFQKNLKRAVDNGLAELLDQAPAVRDFVFQEPEGPVVLNEMLNSKESFVRIMSRGGNPMSAIIEMHDMAKEIRERAKQVPPEQPKNPMPPIGKPGAKQGGNAGSVWDSDEALIEFVRKHK